MSIIIALSIIGILIWVVTGYVLVRKHKEWMSKNYISWYEMLLDKIVFECIHEDEMTKIFSIGFLVGIVFFVAAFFVAA